ncbi:hypothetical protein H0H87_009554 [Tephrocybe sp. NHM501043]|nr:hypothetical protein H0H87_009554 [Tephrocybe sp. NHM501043]
MMAHEPPIVVTQVRTAWMEVERERPLPLARGGDGSGSIDHERQKNLPALPEKLPPLGKHLYRSDGLLDVNPNGPHPIFELIRNAEKAWNAKVVKASKSLAEAVKEYERRYARLPPRGFDIWWKYVQEHNVQLPDEYDQIYEDLEPFWGMDPLDLQRIQSEWEAHSDSYTLGKAEGSPITMVNSSLPGNAKVQHDLSLGAYEVMELLEDVEDAIPPFRAVFSPHDNPNLPTDWELKDQALRHAAAGTFLDINDPPPVKLQGWTAACAPESPAARANIMFDAPAGNQRTKTFIHSHKHAMDPCLHPRLLLLSGQFLSHHKGPVPHRFMVPQFSYSSTMLHHDITPAMPINWVADLPQGTMIDWKERGDDRLQWRGSNTGMWHAHNTRWKDAQRARAVMWAGVGGGVGPGENVTILPAVGKDRRVGTGESVRWGRWAPAMLDVAFAGKPGSCAPEMCKELEKMFEFRKAQDVKAVGNYKYILDIDGNGWSSRFKRLISSNSLIFKSTIYPEWFTERIAPWVHYIPIQTDLSDLPDALTFFRGDPNGERAHEDLGRKIAAAGREWSLKYWRKEDLTAYMFSAEPVISLSDAEANDRHEIWVPSSSEEENFEDAEGGNEDGKWDVEIIDEEVTMNGWGKTPDIRYKAQWKDWTRADGTNVTWNNGYLDENDINIWERKETERRKKLAEESTDIEVEVFSNINVHLTATQCRKHAVKEKLKRYDTARAGKPYESMETLTRKKVKSARERGFNVDSDYGFDAENDDATMADDESTSVHPRTSPRMRLKTLGRNTHTSQPSGSKHPPSSSSSSTLYASSLASSTSVGSPTRAPTQKSLTRSATGSISEHISSCRPQSQSSFTTHLSTKARGKQRALSPSPSFSTITSSVMARGKKRARSPSSLLSEEMNIPDRSFLTSSRSFTSKGKKRVVSPSSTLVNKDIEIRLIKKSKPTVPLARRNELQEEWSTIARRTRAAPITITNDVDDDVIPPLPEGFEYIESEYIYSNKVPRADCIDEGVFVRCECKEKIRCTALCNCQEPSELYVSDKKGGFIKVLAYTPDRLFNAFDTPRTEVIECNNQCACDPDRCPNRVAQRPRDVPIEIFKTIGRGWGVRSTMNIRRGKVLGIYTGYGELSFLLRYVEADLASNIFTGF